MTQHEVAKLVEQTQKSAGDKDNAIEAKLVQVTQKSAAFQQIAETLESRIIMLESALGKNPTKDVAKVLAKFPDLPSDVDVSVRITEVNKKSIALKNLVQKMERRLLTLEALLVRTDQVALSDSQSQRAALGTLIDKLAGVCSAEKKTRQVEKPSINVDEVIQREKAQAEAILQEQKKAHEAALLEHKQAHEVVLLEHKEAQERQINQHQEEITKHVTEVWKLRDELNKVSATQVQEQEARYTSYAESVKGYEAQLKEREALHEQIVSELQAQITAKEAEAQVAEALQKEVLVHQQRALETEEGYKGLSSEHAILQQTLQDHQSKITQFTEEKTLHTEQIQKLKAQIADMKLQHAAALQASVSTRGPEQDYLSSTILSMNSITSSPVKTDAHSPSPPRFSVSMPQAYGLSSPQRAFSPPPMTQPMSGSKRAFSPQRPVPQPMSGSMKVLAGYQSPARMSAAFAGDLVQVMSPRYVVSSPRPVSPTPLAGMGSTTLALTGSRASLNGTPPVVETVVAPPVHMSEKASPRLIRIPAIVPSSPPETITSSQMLSGAALTGSLPSLTGYQMSEIASPRSPPHTLSLANSAASLHQTVRSPPAVASPMRPAIATEMVSPYQTNGGGANPAGLAMSGAGGGKAPVPLPIRRSLVRTSKSPRPSLATQSPRRPLFSSVTGMSPTPRPSMTSSSSLLPGTKRQSSPLLTVAPGMPGPGSRNQTFEGYKYGASPNASPMPTTFAGSTADPSSFIPSPREISRSTAVTETISSPIQTPNIHRSRLMKDSSPVRSSVKEDLMRTAESLTVYTQL